MLCYMLPRGEVRRGEKTAQWICVKSLATLIKAVLGWSHVDKSLIGLGLKTYERRGIEDSE